MFVPEYHTTQQLLLNDACYTLEGAGPTQVHFTSAVGTSGVLRVSSKCIEARNWPRIISAFSEMSFCKPARERRCSNAINLIVECKA